MRAVGPAAAVARAASLVALAGLLAAACAPLLGTPAKGNADERGDALVLCNARSARIARCEPSRAPEVAGACAAVRDTGALRADWVRATAACLANVACTAEDDCETVGYRAIGVGPVDWPPVVRRCAQMGDLCGGTFATCRRLTALTDGARREALRCFSASTCDEYAACFREFVASRLEPAVPSW